ncbi:MAG: hypothetical protein LIP06_15440 [Tannerellaceae bacterium]|nr:hypothetical protein [Tannerellaceae bacterium]
MKKEIIPTEELIRRFFDGETTNREEQELYRFFSQKEIPAHLESYREVFRYFETDLAEEITENKRMVFTSGYTEKLEKWLVTLTAVAAAILFLIVGKNYLASGDTFDPYEGSYIMENGVKITDPDRIRTEVERAYQVTMELEKKISQIRTHEEKYASYMNYMENPYLSLVEQFEDEKVQEEMKKILSNK